MANAVIVDLRSPDEFAAGHVEGAINIPLDALAERASELPQGAVIVTVCGEEVTSAKRGELHPGSLPTIHIEKNCEPPPYA